MLEPPLPPASTFPFAPYLGIATLIQCHLSDNIIQTIRFPQLKKFALQRVRISEDSLHIFIAGFPIIECLLLNYSFGFCCVRINCSSLKSNGLSAGHHVEVTSLVEFIIEDAPCLEKFLYLEQWMDLRVSVITAPNLETWGPLGDLISTPDLPWALSLFSHAGDPNSTTPDHIVKNLAVNIFPLSLDVIIDMMRCFPCLKKLYIQSHQGGDNNLWCRNP